MDAYQKAQKSIMNSKPHTDHTITTKRPPQKNSSQHRIVASRYLSSSSSASTSAPLAASTNPTTHVIQSKSSHYSTPVSSSLTATKDRNAVKTLSKPVGRLVKETTPPTSVPLLSNQIPLIDHDNSQYNKENIIQQSSVKRIPTTATTIKSHPKNETPHQSDAQHDITTWLCLQAQLVQAEILTLQARRKYAFIQRTMVNQCLSKMKTLMEITRARHAQTLAAALNAKIAHAQGMIAALEDKLSDVGSSHPDWEEQVLICVSALNTLRSLQFFHLPSASAAPDVLPELKAALSDIVNRINSCSSDSSVSEVRLREVRELSERVQTLALSTTSHHSQVLVQSANVSAMEGATFADLRPRLLSAAPSPRS